jgi:hypothetical protein
MPTKENALSAREIYEGMTKGEWEPDHDKQPSAIIADEHVCQFYNRDEDDYPNTPYNIPAVCAAVNGSWNKKLDPDQYENLVAAATEALKHAVNHGNFYIEDILRAAIEAARIK